MSELVSEYRPYASHELIAGRYRVLAPLGAGAMGWVLKVEDTTLDGQVLALKVLYPHLTENRDSLSRFRKEVLTTHRLLHPKIVRTYSFAASKEGICYLTMEYVQGADLSEHLKGSNFSLEESLRILQSVAEGMGHAHRCGIVHRDLKPENILLSDSGEVKVADFGISQVLQGPGSVARFVETFGTPKYMSPEQFRGEVVDVRSDIYSFGILAFELLCARAPFDGRTVFRLSLQHCEEPLPAFPEELGHYPQWVREFVETCCEKRKEDRFQDFDEISRILAHQLPENETFQEIPAPSVTAKVQTERVDPRWRHIPEEQRRAAMRMDRGFFIAMCLALLLAAVAQNKAFQFGSIVAAVVALALQVVLRQRILLRSLFLFLLFALTTLAVVRTNPATWKRVALWEIRMELRHGFQPPWLRQLLAIPFDPRDTGSIYAAFQNKRYVSFYKELVEVLARADIPLEQIRDETGQPLLHQTLREGSHLLPPAFIRYGIDPDLQDAAGLTVMHLAAAGYGNASFIEGLLGVGANPDMLDAQGRSPLWYAWNKGDPQRLFILVEGGATPELPILGQSTTALHQLAPAIDAEGFRRILLRVKYFDVQDAEGKTVLHRLLLLKSAAYDRVEKILLLIEAGASMSIPDENGITALDMCEDEPLLEELLNERLVNT